MLSVSCGRSLVFVNLVQPSLVLTARFQFRKASVLVSCILNLEEGELRHSF